MSSFSLPCPTPTTCREHCCGGWCVPRAALAQERAEPEGGGNPPPPLQAEPVQAPVAWCCACGANLYIDEYGHPASRAVPVSYGQTLKEAMRETREKAQAYEAGRKAGLAHQAEPVEQLAELQAMLRAEVDRLIAAGIQPQRKLVPLTEEEIERIGMKHVTLREVIRAVERAHGIKG